MVKTLELDLGRISPLANLSNDVALGPVLATGWYVDQITGEYYYYDATIAQWYVYAAGYLYPLAYIPPTMEWKPSPSAIVELNFGDTLSISTHYKYRGPAGRRFTIYAAVCNNTKSGEPAEWSGFAGAWALEPAGSDDWADRYTTLNLVCGQAGYPTHSGEVGAVYFKIENYRSPAYWDAIHVISPKGEFSDLTITSIAKV